jgi:hypothetical protein
MSRMRVPAALRRLRSVHDGPEPAMPPDPLAEVPAEDLAIMREALPYTMTGVARLQALVDAVRYCVRRDVPGDFAECGVWRGGSVLAMIRTMQEMGHADRDIYLYDTFEGMTEPSAFDTSAIDGSALDAWTAARERDERPWPEAFGSDAFNEDDVRATVLATGYPPERLHFVRGKVEDTIPGTMPGELALLRLDTDWYESTRHELRHLYPALNPGGVLIIDDYGHWDGARRAVDEYFAQDAAPLLLNRIDYSGRVAVKA